MPSENMLCTLFWLPAMAMASEVELREEERMRRRISVASDSLSQSRMTESYRVSASLAEASAEVEHSSTLTPSASRIPRRTRVVASSAHTTRLFSAIRSHPKVTAGWRQVTRVTGWDGEESNPHLKEVIGYGADLVCVSENRQFPLLRATSLGVRSSSLPGARTVTSVTVPELRYRRARQHGTWVL